MSASTPDLLRAFSDLGQLVLGAQPLDSVTQRVAEAAATTVPGADEVSVMLVNGTPPTVAYTGDLARDLDERQYEQGHGPCLAAAEAATTLLIVDVATETRWPAFTPLAADRGAASILSIGMAVHQKSFGAINIYSRTVDAFGEAAIDTGEAFARYAAVALANASLYQSAADLADQTRDAMESRASIEQAKGIVMLRRSCSAEAAFTVLLDSSQRHNRKVADIAAAVVAQVQLRGGGGGSLPLID